MKIISVILLCAFVFGSGIRKNNKADSGYERVFNNPVSFSKIDSAKNLLHDGDLVLRLNQDPISRFIKQFNSRDKKYSHAGLVFFENGQPYIYHMINGEDNPGDKLKRETFARFCNPNKNSAFGIYRYKISVEEIKKMKSLVHKWYDEGISFDLDFNMATDQEMYCSEMISKALALSTQNRILTGTTRLSNTHALFLAGYTKRKIDLFIDKELVAIDDLYKPEYSFQVKEFKYKN